MQLTLLLLEKNKKSQLKNWLFRHLVTLLPDQTIRSYRSYDSRINNVVQNEAFNDGFAITLAGYELETLA